MPAPLTPIQLEFIFENKDKMKQVDIANELNISAAVVNYKLKGRKAKIVVMENFFDIDKEYKKYYGSY